MKIVISEILAVEIDEVFRRVRVNECVYSLDLLAGGFETPPGKVAKIRKSMPRLDGFHEIIVTLQDEQP